MCYNTYNFAILSKSSNQGQITYLERVPNCAASAIAELRYCPLAHSSSWECYPKQTPLSARLPSSISLAAPLTSAFWWQTLPTTKTNTDNSKENKKESQKILMEFFMTLLSFGTEIIGRGGKL